MVMKQPARRFGPVRRRRKRGRPRTYPWEKWFAIDTSSIPLTVTKGVHFHCQVHGMYQQFRQRALERGIQVSMTIEHDTTILVWINRPIDDTPLR